MSSPRTSPAQRPAEAGRGGTPALLFAVSILVVLGVLVWVVALTRGDDSTQGEAGHSAGMAHVHGLGVDPGSGQLMAGTHFGAFRVGDDGRVEQVGPVQDFMGFTVVGPDHYLASGHPGAGQDGPGNLGLIESTDGGRSWQALSLSGEADFHTLEARHGRVYGHWAGRLMVSQDKKTWDERASIPLADLAISPADPDTMLATTEQGLVVSTDGGRTFDVVPDAPLMVLLTWSEDGGLVGVDPVGGVHASTDGGTTWAHRGTAGGQPAALTATDQEVFVATREGSIVVSADGGRTFEVRYREG